MQSNNKSSSTKDNRVVHKKIYTDDPNWQATKITVYERHAVLFNNDLMSDIKFLVGTHDHIQTVPAHKFILATGSSVFYAMFYGSLAEKTSEIRLPDVEPSAFLALLKYLYYDEIHLEADNVISTLYVSKKYLVPHLAKACANYLETKLTAENACFLLGQSRIFDESELTHRCWKVIDTQTELVIKSKGFLDIDQTTLQSILSRETLSCKEIDLFEATVKWADAACEKIEIKPTPQNRRDVIGQSLTLIRFPIMTLKEFADRVTHLEILTPDESNDIFRTLTSEIKPNIFNFSTKHRTEPKKTKICNRVDSSRSYGCMFYSERSNFLVRLNDSIELVVNKKIFIIGFGIDDSYIKLLSEDDNVKIQLKQYGRVLAENNTTHLRDFSTQTLQFLFKDPIQIDPDIYCTAFVSVTTQINTITYPNT